MMERIQKNCKTGKNDNFHADVYLSIDKKFIEIETIIIFSSDIKYLPCRHTYLFFSK